MSKHLFSVLIIVVLATFSAFAQSSEEKQMIERAVLDYAEGWYEGDADKMESSLHPDLAKRSVQTNDQGKSRIQELSALGLVQVTRPGYGKNTAKADQLKTVDILDVFNGIATVRLEMHEWVDYMHLGKFNGKWVIINVLWEPKRAK